MTVESPLPADQALDLWRRVAGDDPTAPPEFAQTYLDWLADSLAASYPRFDPHDHDSAAEDAIMAIIRKPRAYDPTRSSFGSFLRLIARRRLLSRWRAEKPHRDHRADLELVELSGADANIPGDLDADPARRVEEAETVEELRSRLRPEIVARFTPDEEKVFQLMRSGERRAGAYAAALALDELPPEEQRRRIKQVKDRLKKRLRRGGGPDG